MEKDITQRVKAFREEFEDVWPTPPPMDCWNYIVQEVAEIGDALMRLGYGERQNYLRMHNRLMTQVELMREIGDATIMLATLCIILDIDMCSIVDLSLTEKRKMIKEEMQGYEEAD